VPAYGEGCYRLFEGFVYLFAVAGFIGVAIPILAVTAAQMAGDGGLAGPLFLKLFAEPLAGFALLFATFYGYSRMAEGSALLFGFEVPQNFNRPHLARDLGDFWKRWHRSMADFVMQYIYLPLLVLTSRTKLALIAAFGFMGLWHNFSLGFLIWGLGHGIGLGFLLPWAQQRNVSTTLLRIASLAYVVALSAIAHGVWSK
jgi:D-alanyl-lipoteichoic acid acyltransferase DltB (MBOAT superfamily)